MTYPYIQLWKRKLYVIHMYDYQDNQVEKYLRKKHILLKKMKKKGLKELCSWKNKIRLKVSIVDHKFTYSRYIEWTAIWIFFPFYLCNILNPLSIWVSKIYM